MPLRLRRGTDAERLTITPAEGELIYTTDLKRVYVGDGTTVGGVQITSESIFNNLEADLDLNNFDIIGTGNINIDGDISGNLVGDVTGSLFANDSSVLVDGISGNHYGLFNGNLIGNVTGNLFGNVTGNLSGNVNGNVIGDVQGSLFADNSTVLVDGLNGNHYGTFNGNLIGNVTGNVLGNVTGNVLGNVTGDLLGNVTGNVLGNVDGFVNGDLKGSVFGDDSNLIIDGLTNSVLGTVRGKINSSLPAIVTVNDENQPAVSIFLKTAPSKGRIFNLFGFKGSSSSPQEPDLNSRLSLGFSFWSNSLNNYELNSILNITKTSNAARLFLGIKDFNGNLDYGLSINGTSGISSLSNFSTISLNAPTVNVQGNGTFAGTVNAASFKGSVVGDDSTVIVDAINSTIAVSGFIQFGSYSKTDRDNLGAANGMVLYNTTSNRFQGYQNGAWINLDDGSLDP